MGKEGRLAEVEARLDQAVRGAAEAHSEAERQAAELKKAAAVLAAENASVEGKLHKEVEKVDKAKEALKVGIAERKQLQAEVKALEARLSTTSRDEQKSQGRLSSAAEVKREPSSSGDELRHTR